MSSLPTDRADAAVEGSLVRAPSHGNDGDDDGESVHSHHARFAAQIAEERPPTPRPVIDIEHMPVDDDPREWPERKKNLVLLLMTIAVLGPMISPSVFNPVLDEVRNDMHSTDTQIGLTLSIYILLQGCVPVIWAPIAEIFGRKPVYLVSFVLYTVGSAVGSRSPNMHVLIGMRCLQALGSSAVLSSGAGSLADMFEIKERGRKLGWFYGVPMMGPCFGPLIGGALGNAYGWRSTLYFLAVFAAIMTIAFVFFPDTWRKERSRVYQKAIADQVKRQLKAERHAAKKRQRKLNHGLPSTAATPEMTNPGTPVSGAQTPIASSIGEHDVDAELGGSPRKPASRWRMIIPFGKKEDDGEPRPSLRDINPVPTFISIFHSPTNAIVLFASGLLFAAQYTTTYTASLTFSQPPYNYNPLIVGITLLAFGGGNVLGTVLGGRYSDWYLKRATAANGGISIPEMRLRCTLIGHPLIIASYLVWAWTTDKKVMIAGPVVALVSAGFSLMFVYSSTLAYLVDSNPGRSASAVSCNSFMRGVFACIMSQVALPIQRGIGDGGLYTLFAGLLCLSCAGLFYVAMRGDKLRTGDYKFSKKNREARKPKVKKLPSDNGSEITANSVMEAKDERREEKA